jgi:hypothetical protein
MNKPERRCVTHEFRVSKQGETPQISGYACVFDSPSEDIGWIEEVDPKAFNNVMSGSPDVRALFNHNADMVLGRTKSGTLHLSIDARGLAYVIDPPDTQVARDLIVSMQRGDVNQSSFGFVCARDQWTENADGTVSRRILEFAELLDVSPVTYPAFTSTSSGIRSLPESMPTELRSRFEKRDNQSGCTCDCAQCEADACTLCSNVDCNDAVRCSCKQQASRSIQIRSYMEMQLALADLRK